MTNASLAALTAVALLCAACAGSAPPSDVPPANTAARAGAADDKRLPAFAPTPEDAAEPPPEDETAEEKPTPPKSAKTYTRSKWRVGKMNASDSNNDHAIDVDPIFVIDEAASKLGLKRARAGGGGGCDYRFTTVSFTDNNKSEYTVEWIYPAPKAEVVACDDRDSRPEAEKLNAASVREIDADAGVIVLVKTDEGDRATAKKLFNAIFTKN